MKCPICNFESSDDSKFCCGCGRPFPCCPTCGNVLTTRDRFCVHDGTRLPDELLMLVPEEPEEVVEQVDVAQVAAHAVLHSLDETIQVPVKNNPTAYCLRCGSPIWQGKDYCAGCRAEMQKAEPVCASCGMPCEPGEDYCAYCRPADPVPVTNMDYIPPVTRERPAKKKKRGSVFTAILVILLLLLIGAAAVLVAAEFDLIELPEIFGAEDSGRDRDKDRDTDDDADADDGKNKPDNGDDIDNPTDNGGSDATTGTTPPETTAPTTAPTTTAPTEPATQPAQTKLEYFMENCDSVIFDEDDIAGFTKAEARYARNACYAQAGRKFKDKALQAYFEEYYWYNPTYEPAYFDQNSSDLMNYYEKQNLKLIRAYEQEKGYN